MVGWRNSRGTFRARIGALTAFVAVIAAAIISPPGLMSAQAQSGDSAVTYTADLSLGGTQPAANESGVGSAILSRVEADESAMAYDVTFQNRGRRIIGLRLHWTSAGGPGGVVVVLDHRERSERADGQVDFKETFGSDAFTGPWTGISLDEFERRAARGEVVVGVATEWGQTRFVDYLPAQVGSAPVDETNVGTAELAISDDGSAMAYNVVFDRPDQRIIGLRLHWASAGGPGGVIAVLDHRSRSERPDGTTHFAGTFTSDDFTGPWRGRSIDDLQRRIETNEVVIGVATEDLRDGPFPGPASRSVDYLPAQMKTSAGATTLSASADLRVARDGSTIDYVVRVPDLGSRIIGLRLQLRPGNGDGCASSVAAVLNHQSRSVLDDGATVIEGFFDGPWQLWKPTPTMEQISSLHVVVATEADRLGAICGPLTPN